MNLDIISILRDNGRFGANELSLTNQFSGVGEDTHTLICDVNTSMLSAKAEALMRELGLWVRKEATQDERETVARTLRFGSYYEPSSDEDVWLYLMPISDGEKWFGRQSFEFLAEYEDGVGGVVLATLDELVTLKIDVQLDGKFPIWHLLCFFQTGCDDHFWDAIQLIQNAGGNFETV